MRSVDKGMGDLGGMKYLLPSDDQVVGMRPGFSLSSKGDLCTDRVLSILYNKEWLFFQMRVSPSVMGGSKCGYIVP